MRFLLLTVCFSFSAMAITPKQESRLPDAKELTLFKSCKQDLECSVTNVPCGLWQPMNKAWIPKYTQLTGKMKCMSVSAKTAQPPVKCLKNTCVFNYPAKKY